MHSWEGFRFFVILLDSLPLEETENTFASMKAVSASMHARKPSRQIQH